MSAIAIATATADNGAEAHPNVCGISSVGVGGAGIVERTNQGALATHEEVTDSHSSVSSIASVAPCPAARFDAYKPCAWFDHQQHQQAHGVDIMPRTRTQAPVVVRSTETHLLGVGMPDYHEALRSVESYEELDPNQLFRVSSDGTHLVIGMRILNGYKSVAKAFKDPKNDYSYARSTYDMFKWMDPSQHLDGRPVTVPSLEQATDENVKRWHQYYLGVMKKLSKYVTAAVGEMYVVLANQFHEQHFKTPMCNTTTDVIDAYFGLRQQTMKGDRTWMEFKLSVFQSPTREPARSYFLIPAVQKWIEEVGMIIKLDLRRKVKDDVRKQHDFLKAGLSFATNSFNVGLKRKEGRNFGLKYHVRRMPKDTDQKQCNERHVTVEQPPGSRRRRGNCAVVEVVHGKLNPIDDSDVERSIRGTMSLAKRMGWSRDRVFKQLSEESCRKCFLFFRMILRCFKVATDFAVSRFLCR